jgi:transketolase
MEEKARDIRKLLFQTLVPGASHHIGSCLSCVEILTALYFKLLKVDSQKPDWNERDIFLMSKGHAGAVYFCVLAAAGFFDKELLGKFDVDNGILPEHVSRVVPGVELSTGSLGHALPVANGFALAFKNENRDNKVVVLNSDGELDEGSNWEAAAFAAHHKFDNIISIVDVNGFQGYGATEKVLKMAPLSEKFVSFGWEVFEIDGHNFEEIEMAYHKASHENGKPKVILAHTIKGKGIAKYENNQFESHYMGITKEEKEKILKSL